jgi:hypothetical protein
VTGLSVQPLPFDHVVRAFELMPAEDCCRFEQERLIQIGKFEFQFSPTAQANSQNRSRKVACMLPNATWVARSLPNAADCKVKVKTGLTSGAVFGFWIF